MSNLFPPSTVNTPKVGSPTVVLGTLFISVPSIVHGSLVSSPSVGQINLTGYSISNDQQNVGYPKLYSTSQVNEVHPQVEFQVPAFIRDDHQAFVEFIRAYYRYSEKKEGALYFLRRLLSVQNIDTTTTELIEFFFREYAPSFPRSTALSPALIIKNIRQFYLAKGSEKSFRFLFRVFFGQDVDFYYPRLDILRFSDGKWVQDRTVKCIVLSGDPSKLIGNRIVGMTTRASAFVEKVLLVQDGTITTYELFLNRSSIVGKFEANEIIRDESATMQLRLLPIISSISITTPGRGYQEGQEVLITGEGFNCKARINSVDNVGAVKAVQVFQFGAGYSEGTTFVQFPTYDGVTEQAFGKAVFDTISKYPGYFLNSDGMLSSLKAIQDSYYYQQFSYVIKAEESRDRYDSIVRNLVHPAGFIFFSEVFSESQIDASNSLPIANDGSVATETELFTDLQQDWNQFNITEVPEFVFVDAEATLDGTDVEVTAEDTNYADDNAALGPTWADWETWKTDYRPTPVFGQPTDEILQPGYYALYANTPLKAFADVKLSEIAFRPWSSIDHLPETTILQEIDGP